MFTEYTTENGRRINIVITTNSGQLIPIEVKIYAYDLENQCKDYYEEAKRYCEDAKISYITTDGHAKVHVMYL